MQTLLVQDKIKSQHIDNIAKNLAEQHRQLLPAANEKWLSHLQTFIQTTQPTHYQDLIPLLQQRYQAGFVRAYPNNDMDIMQELAFFMTELEQYHAFHLSARLLNNYLEQHGNYSGLKVLRFFQFYWAMQHFNHPQLAQHYQQPNLSPPSLMITVGVSGSGKSTITEKLLEHLGAVRLRSDVERKRLFNLDPLDRCADNSGLYDSQTSQIVFRGLEGLAKTILQAGFPVIIDATFLKREHRTPFKRLANQLKVPFLILHCQAQLETLHKRIMIRQQTNHDPSDATIEIMQRQLASRQTLNQNEQIFTVNINTEDDNLDMLDLAKQIQQLAKVQYSNK